MASTTPPSPTRTTSTSSPTMRKPKRSLSLSLLLFLFSFLALSFLLFILCFDLRILCFFPNSSIPIPPPPPPPPLLNPKPPQSSHLYPRPAHGLRARPKSPRQTLLLKSLRPNPRSRRFPTRATEFLRGSSPNPRFFMTWLSPADEFGPRERFAVQALFRSHKNATLLIASDTLDSPRGARLLGPFVAAGLRVAAMCPSFPFLLAGTPAAPWFDRLRRGSVDPGDVPLAQNLSNLLRLLLLYKFGGVYVDADVLVLRSFARLRNAIGAQTLDPATGSWSRLNNAVMVFDKMHPLLYEFLKEFAETFDGRKWGHNGPYLVSRVVTRVLAERSRGFGFGILPPSAFYPVDWSRVSGFFKGPQNGAHLKWVVNKLSWIRRESFAVHLWHRESRGIRVEEGSIIGRIISDFCLFCNFSVSDL
ncbi:Uncharacterized protein ACMD2_17776 [Ananas comosus]|uniref:Alpha 1,4-glycosyltransferase domain-containing protein n=1 Tax=Ananas comosus TaxID=4615 RepID=A0A199UD79_ANACO|nr:Uncharacterized protein ACMD2_17776 [Ananas comosus]